eukprot:6479442-Amphidinium_carterae.1
MAHRFASRPSRHCRSPCGSGVSASISSMIPLAMVARCVERADRCYLGQLDGRVQVRNIVLVVHAGEGRLSSKENVLRKNPGNVVDGNRL